MPGQVGSNYTVKPLSFVQVYKATVMHQYKIKHGWKIHMRGGQSKKNNKRHVLSKWRSTYKMVGHRNTLFVRIKNANIPLKIAMELDKKLAPALKNKEKDADKLKAFMKAFAERYGVVGKPQKKPSRKI